MSVFVGLDCGGSSSRVLAIDEIGNILFQGQSGAANLVSTPEARLKRNLANATRGCDAADFVCGCFAGLLGDETRTLAIQLLEQIFPGAMVRAEPDYTAAFYSCPQNTDVCVIAGTGSLVCSKKDNRIVKSGGRGYLLGDEGSGYHYGRDALVHFLNFPHQSSTALVNMIDEVFGSREESRIISAVYKNGTSGQMLARFAKVLGMDANANDSYALESIERNGTALSGVVRDHVKRYLEPKPTLNVCLAGGIWKAAPIFKNRFEELLSQQMPDRTINVTRITKPPLQGALELAKELQIGN